MAGESKDLKLRLAFEYDSRGLSAFRSDVESVLAMARGGAGDLDALADGISGIAGRSEDASSALADLASASGDLAGAAGGADDLSASLAEIASEADSASGALGGLDSGGLDDAASGAGDLEASLSDAAGTAESVGDSLGSIDGGGLDTAAGSAGDVSTSLAGAAESGTALVESVGKLPGLLDASAGAAQGVQASVANASGPAGAGGLLSKLGGIGAAVAGPAAVAAGAVAGIGLAAGVAGAGALAIGDSFDGAYDAIAIATGATGERLDELQGQFKSVVSNVPTDFGSAAEVIGVLGQRLDFVGDVEALGTQILNLSRITGVDAATAADKAVDSFAKFNIAARDQGAALDLLFRLSQESGVGFDELQSSLVASSAVLQSAGLDYEHAATLIASLGQSGVDASEVLPGLSRALSAAAKEGLDADAALAQITDAIKGAGSEAEAQQIAVEAFGKGGLKMAQALRSGALDATFLTASLENSAGAINDTASSTDDFGQRLDLLKNKALVALEPIGSLALGAANGLVDAFAPIADQVLGALGPLAERLSAFLGPVIERITGGLGSLDFSAIGTSLSGVGDTLSDAFSDPAVGNFLATLGEKLPEIGAFLTGTLIPILIDVGANFARGFRAALPVVLNLASALIDTLWPIVQSVFSFIAENREQIADTWSLFTSPISALGVLADELGGVRDALASIGDIELPDIGAWLDSIELPSLDMSGLLADIEPPDLGGLFADVTIPALDLSSLLPELDLSPITGAFDAAWANIQTGIDSAWAEFDSTIQAAQDAIYAYLLDIWLQIPEDIRADLALIASHILEQFEAYRATIEEKTGEARDFLYDKWAEIRADFDAALAWIEAEVTATFESVYDAIVGPLSRARAALSGVWSDVESRAVAAWDSVQAAISGAVTRALAVLSDLRSQVEVRAREAWGQLVAAAESALAPLVDVVEDATSEALAFVSGVRSRIEGVAREAWTGFVAAAESALGVLKTRVLAPVQDALAGLASLGADARNRALEIGRSIIDGIVSTVVAGKERLIEAALAGVRGLLDAIKGFLGIASPSRALAEVGTAMMLGLAVGIADGTPLAVQAMQDATRQVLESARLDIPPEFARLLFEPDPQAAAEIARLAQAIWDTSAALRAAEAAADAFDDARLDEAISRITAAMNAWFTASENARGSLASTLAIMRQAGAPDVNEGAFLGSLGFDAVSFAELHAQIAALDGEPERQREMWKAVVDALLEDWGRFYDAQNANLEAQKKALEEQVEAAGPDANTEDLDRQIAGIEAAMDLLDERNRSIADGLSLQGDGLDRMMEAYGRIAGEQERLARAEEDARRAREAAVRALEDDIKARQKAAEDAEKDAHDQAMDLLDEELKARERAYQERMAFLDSQREAEEQAVKRRMAEEEEAHRRALAAITAQVDAQDVLLAQRKDDIDKAKELIDLVKTGTQLTAEQAAFLRGVGIDPDKLIQTNNALTQANTEIDHLTKRLDVLQGLFDKLPSELGRVRIAGSNIVTEAGKQLGEMGATFGQAERDRLQELLDTGALDKRQERLMRIFLAGGRVQAQKLREILGPQITQDETALKNAQDQVALAKEQTDEAAKLLASKEAQLKVDERLAAEARAALQEQIDAENRRHEDVKAHAQDRLSQINEQREAEQQAYSDFKEAVAEAKEAEAERHRARMKAIDEEYALELLRAGKSEDEVQKILDEQRARAAAIAAEAERRFNEMIAAAQAAVAPIVITLLPGPGGRQAKQPGLTPPPPPSQPLPPPPPTPFVAPGTEPIPIGDMFAGIEAAAAVAGQGMAAALVDPALARMDDLYARALDISGLFASRPDVAAFMGGGTAHVDNGIHFHGDVYIDRDVAEEIGLYDAARIGAP